MKLIVGAPLIPDKSMNQNFYYKLFNLLLKKNKNNEGFTLAELIVSGFVSLLVLIAGFTFLRMNLEVNKSDETNLKLGGKLNNALDFIVDEINSSKKVITKNIFFKYFIIFLLSFISIKILIFFYEY